MRQLTRTRKSRQAAATVELAICLPVVLTIAFGTIDICSVLFLKESLTIAAYEGARAGMPQGGTNAIASAKVFSILQERGIKFNRSNAVSISTPGFDNASELTHVTLKVQVAANENTVSLSRLFFGKQIEAQVVCVKQFKNE